MNSLSKVEVIVSFPLGANFHQNIVDYTYKSFLKMIKKLSCINIDSKCKDCPFNNKCQYYYVTGQNFNNYPGIIFKKDNFIDNLFRNNDEFCFEIYLIGNCNKYKSYIDIFFKEYTDYKLAGYYYQIKQLSYTEIEDEFINIDSINIVTLVESTDFKIVYNDMVDYYNQYYQSNISNINNIKNILNIKHTNNGKFNLNTKKVYLDGYIYLVHLNDNVLKSIIDVGVGKYNCLGGGHIEIKNKIKCR